MGGGAGGLLVGRSTDGWRAWFGVRLTAATDLTQTRGYADLSENGRYRDAHAEDVRFLERQLGTDDDSAVEARWVATPSTGQRTGWLSGWLLGRAGGATEERARSNAGSAAARLAGLPGHVAGVPIDDPEELRAALRPFSPEQRVELAELRRRCLVATPARPDAGVRYYFAVAPFQPNPRRWLPVLDALLAVQTPTMLTVGLEPWRVPPEFTQLLAAIAGQLGPLAREGELYRAGIYGRSAQRLAPDPAAVLAERLYRDAARRYQGAVFRLRVGLAGVGHLDGRLVDAVGAALAPDGAGLPHPAYVVERPGAAEQGTLARAFAGLGVPRWGGDPLWSGPDAPPAALRLLTELADPTEAAAAFWLPASVTGALPGLPTWAPHPDRQVPSPGVHFHAAATVHGDVVAGDKRWYDPYP
ncbi:MAG TPA: hypothetical protein VLJ59_11460 [Mycobacteriales bacterium]|nr:hypothetical protein [Mycobacteriales bacterium]